MISTRSILRPGWCGWCTLLLVTALLMAGCGESEDERSYQIGEPIDNPEIAAIVTSEFGADTLSARDFQMQVSQMMQLPDGVIEAFIARHVLGGEADRRDIFADDAEVDQQLATLRDRFEDQEAFEAALAQEQMTETSLRDAIAQSIRMREMETQLTGSVAEPTDEEVEAYRREQSRHVEGQHILFRVPQEADEEERAAIRERGEAVLDSIMAGADFAEMARRHGEDATAEHGGELGLVARGQTVPEFEDALFALADSGDVASELVETNFGYHIIRKTGEREMDVMSERHAQRMLLQERQHDRLENELQRLKRKATVRVNPQVTGTTLREHS